MVFGIDHNTIDGEILHEIRDWFGCGKVSLKKDRRERFSDQLQFQVRDLESLEKIIIPFFQKYPLRFTKKKKTFEKFVELAKIKKAKEHIGAEGFLKAQNLARQLHS